MLNAAEIRLTNQLFDALQMDRRNEINEILDRGASVRAYNRDNRTPLHLAAEKGYLEEVRAFLASMEPILMQKINLEAPH